MGIATQERKLMPATQVLAIITVTMSITIAVRRPQIECFSCSCRRRLVTIVGIIAADSFSSVVSHDASVRYQHTVPYTRRASGGGAAWHCLLVLPHCTCSELHSGAHGVPLIDELAFNTAAARSRKRSSASSRSSA